MLGLAASLPDALVGLAPDPGRALGLGLDERPEPPRQTLAALGVEQDRVERGAEDVVLALVESAVADPDRSCARVAGEVVARGLGQVAPTVDPVHDLQGAVFGRLDVGDELHVLVGFPVQVQPVQRLEREGAVADPGVAVVPVPLAAGGLGQRSRQGGHGRAGRHVREPLDRQRGALDRVAPVVIRNPRPLQPGPPVANRRGEPRVRLLDVLRRGELLGPRERTVGAVARLEHVPRRGSGRPRCRAPGRTAGARFARRRAHRRRGGRRRPSSTPPACFRSRRPARRRARLRRCPPGTPPSGRACGRHRRPPEAACAE